jgi:serine/threonine protein kinase
VDLDEYEELEEVDQLEYCESGSEIRQVTERRIKLVKGKGAEGARRGVLNEINALTQLKNHRNIVKLHYSQELYGMMFLVMEYAPGKNLAQIMSKRGRFSENSARWIFAQVCAAVSFCHAKNIAHHDLKPANIIVDELTMNIKLVDFGLCIINTPREGKCEVFSGTPLYCALEILLRKPYNPYSADVWALGVVLYEMLCDALPWNARTYDEFVDTVTHDYVEFPAELSEPVVNLMSSMLEKRVTKRIELDGILAHSWVTDVW